MRTITVKYDGVCKKCGAALVVGQQAAYERASGIFCPGCAPTDTEEIRAYRQERADAKADKYEGWAAKRRERAAAVLKADEWARGDYAFNTQPGHIPGRQGMNDRHDRQYESLETAQRFEAKAESLRHVRVKGDAAARDEAVRLRVLSWIKVGMMVNGFGQKSCEVLKINKNTARIRGQGSDYNERLIFLSPA